ncbi:MAG TPA: histidine kinase [Steroidobacteraceae bacterium]|nr:histidine kinase [Steroidobacteraceae bacterium]
MARFDPLRTNRNTLFWTLQTGGWLCYFASQYLGSWVYEKFEDMPNYGLLVGLAAVTGFLFSLILRMIYRRLWLKPPIVTVFGALICCYVFALLWRVIINRAYVIFIDPAWVYINPLGIFEGVIYSTYILLCWSAIYFGVKYFESLQQQRNATLRAATLAQEAQLKMLRYQLNPHFLFNTLNAISTLILDNENRTANQTVMRLSEFLRYTLDQDPMKKVTLRQEIEAMNLYLTTEKLRFGDRLQLEFAVEERALEALVPSLLLQPLIENAVKYAVSPSERGGIIRVEARARGSMLELAVADDGPGLNGVAVPAAGRGVGLRNTRERLAVLYEDKHRFATMDNKPGLRIELGLPMELAAS